MASKTDLETLVLRIEANTAQYQKNMKRLVDQQKRSTRQIINSNKDVASSFQRTAQSIAVLHGPLGGVASRFSSFASLVRGSGLALGVFAVAASAVTLGMRHMVRVFSEAEVRFKTTEGLLKATSFSAGKTAHQIEMLSRDIALGTLAGTQEVREAANILLTFRSISNKTFDRALRASQDMVASGFGNIKTNAVQLGKALESPREGLTALKRIGVDFTGDQKKLIKTLSDTGRLLEAQRVVLAGVERQMKGAGVAAADSLAGAYDTLTEAGGRTLERWGEMIAKGTRLKGIMSSIGNFLERNNKIADDPRFALKDVDQKIAEIRAKIEKVKQRGSGGLRGSPGTQLMRLHKQREEILKKIKILDDQEAAAAEKSAEAQRQRAAARTQAAIEDLRDRLRKKGLTEEQLMLEQELAKAGVEGGSQQGAVIQDLVKQYMKLLEVKKKNASQTKKTQKEAMKALTDEMKAAQRQAEFFGQSVHTALSDMIFEGKSAAEVIRNLGKSIASAALQRVLVGTGPLGGTGSGAPGVLTSLFSGMKLFAKGGSFNKGAVQAFADGGIVKSPTTFAMRGGMGMMGERGPEAIMPLKRGADGSLGVKMHGSGGMVNNFYIQTQDAQSFMKSEGQIAAMVSRAVSRGQRNL